MINLIFTRGGDDLIGWLMSESDLVITSLAFSITAFAVFFALHAKRSEHANRMYELSVAKDLLDRHYRAATRLATDPATPRAIIIFLRTFSHIIGRRDIARAVAARVAATATSENKNTYPAHAKIDEFLSIANNQVRELQNSRPDLVRLLAEAISCGLTAMMLRWQETDRAAWRFATLSEQPIEAVRKQSSTVVKAAPEEFAKQCA
jgi:hypothetical protein